MHPPELTLPARPGDPTSGRQVPDASGHATLDENFHWHRIRRMNRKG